MQVGSLVETVTDFEDVRHVYNMPYPNKGDILTVSHIDDHHNPKCREKGIVMLSFEELPNTLPLCDKQVDGTPNFIELLPPIEGDYSESNPSKAKSKKPQYELV